ncbi:hypothetical protein BegalDRAFT_1722 [Beggiatoa alba B18LD]|uniref:Endonuclease/exonuclease/phosphatase domain-containing protein n=2 Tax=Beggiatoa alba TaxID=1022 RepID=I3CG56_9GAMM|nr:hypothetical protein BegalDRAFT_1722 [Beggiatoa alba B18LD]
MPKARPVRFATFNASLFRPNAGQLTSELQVCEHPQLSQVAGIIQRVNPDILLLQEFDYAENQQNLTYFQENYLNHPQQPEGHPVFYPYRYAIPSNTGILSGLDLDGDGRLDSPHDAFGFGTFAGQYAFALLAKFPLQLDKMRSFQYFLWRDMPHAKLPKRADGTDYFNAAALDIMRLSSKNHVDIPVELPTGIIHLLIAHPTPPIDDGVPQRNRCRNYDELRLWADYLTDGEQAHYLYDDKGHRGGLSSREKFVLMGDMNADPFIGNSLRGAMTQLLRHPRMNPTCTLGIHVPKRPQLSLAVNARVQRAQMQTSTWGLRVDYILPSRSLWVQQSGIFAPVAPDTDAPLVTCSDHFLVWTDIKLT